MIQSEGSAYDLVHMKVYVCVYIYISILELYGF